MANWGQKVYPSDYAEIKALLKAEVEDCVHHTGH